MSHSGYVSDLLLPLREHLAQHLLFLGIERRVLEVKWNRPPIEIPKDRKVEQMREGIAPTFLPGRNAVFLALACAEAAGADAQEVWLGVNAVDYSGYPDCRPEFIRAFETLANLATKAGVEGTRFTVHTPLIDWSKARIIQEGVRLGLDYGLTHSCYSPGADGRPCGRCDSCVLRAAGFAEAGHPDPLMSR